MLVKAKEMVKRWGVVLRRTGKPAWGIPVISDVASDLQSTPIPVSRYQIESYIIGSHPEWARKEGGEGVR